MKLIKTIRGQLTIYFVLVFGVMLCVFSIILYNVFGNQNRDDLDKSMELLAGAINDEMQSDSIKPLILHEANEIFIPFTPSGQLFVELLDASGNVVLKSPQFKDQDLNLERQWLETALNGNHIFKTITRDITNNTGDSYGTRILLYQASYDLNKFIIVIGVPLSNLEGALFKFRLLLFITVPLTLLLSSVLGWIFSKKAYAPVNDIINKSNSITANNLDTRLPVSESGDEISKLSETLNNMMERLQKSFAVLKQFTSDASHELRTPLTILKGEIEVALNKERQVCEYEAILKNNLEEVERLQKIADGLLTLSQLESGKTPEYHETINLNELLTDAVTKINNLAVKKNIKVVLMFSETKDNNYKQILVNGEYSKLLNVFINLLDNSIKYSMPDREIICTEDLNSAEKTVSVSIKDNGYGIPPEKLENIFDRFYRADLSRARDDRNSIGLGLSIVKSVIEAHNGKITVTSIPGEGTTFTVILPYFSE